MLEADGRNYLLALAYFQRIPGCELYGVGNGDGGGIPQPAEDLIRAWRRSRDEPLPAELRAALEVCDNNTLFNVLGVTIDMLLRRITPVRQNKRARRALKFRRRSLRRALQQTEQRIAAHDAANAGEADAAVGADGSQVAAG
jgi:hypothetical protein